MTAIVTYGGDYDEWGIACPDAEVWPDTFTTRIAAQSALRVADKACGCEQSPHVVVTRYVPEWEATGG